MNRWDVTFAFKVGTVFLVFVLGGTFFLEQCTEGDVPARLTPSKRQNVSGDMDWKAMIKPLAFYIMLLLLASEASSGMMVRSQVYAVVRNMIGMSAIAASAAVSILALFNVGGTYYCRLYFR